MKGTVLLVLSAALLAGCSSTQTQDRTSTAPHDAAGSVLHYTNGWVYYEEPGPSPRPVGVGGVISVTLDPAYVRFETAQGTYVIPRERVVRVDPVSPLPPKP